MQHPTRRRFLTATATAGLTTAAGLTRYSPATAVTRRDRALRDTVARAISPAGTTLDTVATPAGATGYRRLTAGPGWPLVTGEPHQGRPAHRAGQLRPVHRPAPGGQPARSPARFEYLHPFEGAAFRPHETLARLPTATSCCSATTPRRRWPHPAGSVAATGRSAHRGRTCRAAATVPERAGLGERAHPLQRDHRAPRADPAQSFWEINTASHTDFPQHARVIEIAGNGDGTLSLFTTLLEADSPYQADYAGTDPATLASLYRELAFNDLHADPERLGAAGDHNTELLLADPLR